MAIPYERWVLDEKTGKRILVMTAASVSQREETCVLDEKTGTMIPVRMLGNDPEPDVVVEPAREPVAEPVKPGKKKGGRPKKVIPAEETPLPAPEAEPEGESAKGEAGAVLERLRAFWAALDPELMMAMLVNRGYEATSLWVAKNAPLSEATAALTADGWEPWAVKEEQRTVIGGLRRGWLIFWKRRVR